MPFDNSPAPRWGKSSLRAPMMVAIVVAGFVCSVGAYLLGQKAEETRIQASLEHAAGERIAAVETRLLATIGSLRALASLFEAAGEVSPDQFRRFVSPLLTANAGIQAFEWAPQVEAADRSHIESLGAQEFPGFHIVERDAAGALRPAGTHARYFPVFYVEPLAGNEKAVGFDLFSNGNRRAAIEVSVAWRAAQSTPRITLVQETGDQYGVLVFQPVFGGEARNALRGVVLGVFRVGDVVNQGMAAGEDKSLSLSIWDLSADPKDSLLYPKISDASKRAETTFSTSRTLIVGGRLWKVVATASPAYVAQEKGMLPWDLLAACLFLTGNIAWVINRRYAVEEEQAANFDAALTNMSHGLAMFDANYRLVICNQRFVEFFRLDHESCAKGASPSKIMRCAARLGLLPFDDIDKIEQRFAAGTRCQTRDEMTLELRDGRAFELSFQSMARGGAVVIVDDVTDQKAQEARIAHMARFDKLTGLPNRAQFEEKFYEICASSKRTINRSPWSASTLIISKK